MRQNQDLSSILSLMRRHWCWTATFLSPNTLLIPLEDSCPFSTLWFHSTHHVNTRFGSTNVKVYPRSHHFEFTFRTVQVWNGWNLGVASIEMMFRSVNFQFLMTWNFLVSWLSSPSGHRHFTPSNLMARFPRALATYSKIKGKQCYRSNVHFYYKMPSPRAMMKSQPKKRGWRCTWRGQKETSSSSSQKKTRRILMKWTASTSNRFIDALVSWRRCRKRSRSKNSRR